MTKSQEVKPTVYILVSEKVLSHDHQEKLKERTPPPQHTNPTLIETFSFIEWMHTAFCFYHHVFGLSCLLHFRIILLWGGCGSLISEEVETGYNYIINYYVTQSSSFSNRLKATPMKYLRLKDELKKFT